MTSMLDLNFTGRRAVVLHPTETVRTRLASRLDVLGLAVEGHWPDLPAERIDFLFVDIDMGHDGQLHWEPGQAPMPVIGVIRSETPGRLAWALRHNLDAFLSEAAPELVYSSLVIATARWTERARRTEHDVEAARRAGMRHFLIRAVMQIMETHGVDELGALRKLRTLAMVERVALEDAALLVLNENGTLPSEGSA
ncbi:AmiR/NasT family two-component response regulator [Rhodovulum bhavnagarense]|uniref:AmiR/NasT family two-component response regulator n=1 Tax=Rhodovulum bhavnagarense TaxID=992286 RepID=A0A4V6NRK1_9RHOB|nr:transcriptional antiterminator [Rhodovulum bhavnagarense]TCP60666.1 AmiR/NasT family two-component response regulator [Rhodovulum bhavnagarense]